jgi:hypothetical protein
MTGQVCHSLARGSAPDRLERPLVAGNPVTLWRHSPVAAAPFDVPERPMQGEMDPFFFVTRERNVVPHEYPCRSDFIARFRDRRPEERATGQVDQVWLGFGSPRLDLSGFWFRATRLAARGETLILAEAAGTARLRLTTCGGAILRVNGAEVLWLAPYRRNAESAVEAEVWLNRGANRIGVFFDDLAERDARFTVQLDYLSGPDATQAIPAGTSAAAARMVEAALADLRFARTCHDGVQVRLLLPEPLALPALAEITLSGDFIPHGDAAPVLCKLAAGSRDIDLGPADDLPAGFHEVTLRLSAAGFAATRRLGTEISHARRWGPAPDGIAARIDEALRVIARSAEPGPVRALARLALGDGGPETGAMAADALPAIDACEDCADFALVPLIWCRTGWPGLLGAELCARIDATIRGYRYWMDEPGNDVQWYFSENHALLFHTAAHLAGALLPEARFTRSGRTGDQQSRIGAGRLADWFDHFEAWEMAEFNSAPYFPIDIKGLAAIFALSPDAGLRSRAGRAIGRLVEIVANSAHQGVLTAAQGRSYEHSLRATDTQELSSIARLLWGRGGFGTQVHALPLLALCLRDHGLALPDLRARACLTGGSAQEWRFAQGRDRFARLYHHKTADHAMGSAVAYRQGEWGYQETLIHARLGENPAAQFWINHPGEVIHSGFGRPSYWGGSASVPRVQQYRDLAVVVFAGTPPQPDFTHCWFPAPEFDHSQVRGDAALADAGDAHVMLRASGKLQAVTEGPTADHELRLPGRDSWWLVRLGSRAVHGAGFADRFAKLHPVFDGGMIHVADPDYGMVGFHPDGTVEGEGRRLSPDEMTVSGTREILPRGPLRRMQGQGPA